MEVTETRAGKSEPFCFARRVSTSGAVGSRRLLGRRRGDDGVVAVDGRGNALITWSGEHNIGHALYTRVMRRSGRLGRLRTLEKGNDPSYPSVAVNSAGRGVVTWYAADGRVRLRPVSTASVVGRGRTYRRALTGDGRTPSPAVGSDGSVMIAWLRQGGGGVVAVRSRL